MAKKILVLTIGGGAAHNLTAFALKQKIAQQEDNNIDVRIEDLYAKTNLITDGAVLFYSWLHRHAPWFHHVYFWISETPYVMWWMKTLVIYSYYKKLIQEYCPDIIISVFSGYNRRYFSVAKSILGEKTFCVTLCPEYTGGYGFSYHWVDPKADVFWCHTEAVKQQALKLGMPLQKIWLSSNLLRENFYQKPLTSLEKQQFLTQELQLSTHKFTLLFSTNGSGSQNHIDLLNVLLPLADKVQVIILCGNNQSAKIIVKRWCQDHPSLQSCVLGFTEKIPQLLQVSQANIQRPGFLITAESVYCQCPIIFNGIGGFMPQELLAIRALVPQKIAVTMTHPRQILAIVNNWLKYPEQYQIMCQAHQNYYHYPVSAQDRIQELINILKNSRINSQ
ncbi:MAG: hypothetical protein VKJ02_17845 [Snowella sp.]|nr:hypothetical protein [Snowella sp.]